ncbi:stimulated by retinoic acid gene 6 protein-like [Rhinopithecus roxellana]|uniref:stimulated by retinoic acid gene 6 protein-like n=1 Tax=Rhinopithecus roxellana TaxID=61622 RepID=UPI0012372F80|nr:stimulated by retinoic acid gene 6 protein-like [Rhinopithecus roxellana]
MLPKNTRTRQLNGTCTSSVDMELFLHYSLIPSLFIILILSFLQRREHRRQRDDTSYLLGNRFGIIMPLDFVGTFSNRWSYGIAFGATANKVMFLFSEGYQPLQIPQWAQGTRAASYLLETTSWKFLQSETTWPTLSGIRG